MDKIIKKLINTINEYWKFVERANEIDRKYNDLAVKKDEIINIIESYRNHRMNLNKNENKIIFSYYGYTYITTTICMESICKKTDIVLAVEDFQLGVNVILVEIFNDVIKELGLKTKIEIKNSLTKNELEKYVDEMDKAVFIGNEDTFLRFKNNKSNAYFVPFNNIWLYCSDESLEELKRKIYDVCMENYFEIEIFDREDGLESTIDLMNEYAYTCVLFSKDEEEKELFREKIKKEYYINKNPINYGKVIIPSEIFE